MPSYIVKVSPERDAYIDWSTITDHPGRVGTRAEFAIWCGEDRLARADERGTSCNLPGCPADRQPYGWSDTEFHLHNNNPAGLLPRVLLSDIFDLLSTSPDANIPAEWLNPFEDETPTRKITDADALDKIAEPARKWAERDMLDALHARYSQTSQGTLQRWVRAEHVRAACGFGGYTWGVGGDDPHARTMRTADFLAQDTWEAQGLLLHGHEVKVSRADWLTELGDPSKAEAIKRFCDRWWLVVPDRSIVRDDLPDGWGLLAFDKTGKLRVYKRAPTLQPEQHPATFRAAFLRAAAKTAERRSSGRRIGRI